MQDTDLLLSLAEIAGVFVGFGALISVRTSGASDPHEVTYIRVVVWTGLLVVIAALAPVVISRYGIAGHGMWVACSLLVLALFWGLWLTNRRTPEHRMDMATYPRAVVVEYTLLLALLVVPQNAALILVVLGLFPDLEPALYLTAGALGLILGGVALLGLVFSQGRPQTA
jgi:hypothetical protein